MDTRSGRQCMPLQAHRGRVLWLLGPFFWIILEPFPLRSFEDTLEEMAFTSHSSLKVLKDLAEKNPFASWSLGVALA